MSAAPKKKEKEKPAAIRMVPVAVAGEEKREKEKPTAVRMVPVAVVPEEKRGEEKRIIVTAVATNGEPAGGGATAAAAAKDQQPATKDKVQYFWGTWNELPSESGKSA